MSEWQPSLDTENMIDGLVATMIRELPYLLGVDESIPNCEVIDLDPDSTSPALPRPITVRINTYYQTVTYRGFPDSLTVGDFITVLHMAKGDTYEVWGAGGSGGSVDPSGGVSTPPHFSAGDILLNLTFDHLKFYLEDGEFTQKYAYLTSRRDRAWVLPSSADYESRGALSMVPSLWPFRRGFRADRSGTNLITNPSFEVDTAGWAVVLGAMSRTMEYAWSQVWGLEVLANAQHGGVNFTLAAPGAGTYSGSVWVRADSTTVHLDLYNASTATSLGVVYHPGDGQWHKLVVNSGTIGAGENLALWIQDDAAAGWTAYQVDAAQIEATAYHTPYIDGDLGDGHAWSGANHASTSSRTRGYIELSDMVNTINERESYAVRTVFQTPYDSDFAYWPSGSPTIWDARGADNNNRILVRYDDGNEVFTVYINGAIRLTSAVHAFTEGEWFDIVVKFNFGLYDSYELWVNGEQEDTDTTALTAPTLTSWRLGANVVNSNFQCGWILAEYTVYESDTLLTETLIEQLYLTGPTIDPESVLEERLVPAGVATMIDGTAHYLDTSDVYDVEYGATNGYRFLFAGHWHQSSHFHLEVSMAVNNVLGTASFHMEYYDTATAAWRTVPGSSLSTAVVAANRYMTPPLTIPQGTHEYRYMVGGSSGDYTYYYYKIRFIASHGGDTAL